MKFPQSNVSLHTETYSKEQLQALIDKYIGYTVEVNIIEHLISGDVSIGFKLLPKKEGIESAPAATLPKTKTNQ